jgi:hypothetical protein
MITLLLNDEQTRAVPVAASGLRAPNPLCAPPNRVFNSPAETAPYATCDRTPETPKLSCWNRVCFLARQAHSVLGSRIVDACFVGCRDPAAGAFLQVS